jgi:hypothetical protein
MDKDLAEVSTRQIKPKTTGSQPLSSDLDAIAEARQTLVEWLRAKNQSKVEAERRK